jgi:hypothetical protein
MKRKRKNHYNNKVGDSCRNCNRSSTTNFAKNKSTITDNEYEVNSETNNCSNKKRCR